MHLWELVLRNYLLPQPTFNLHQLFGYEMRVGTKSTITQRGSKLKEKRQIKMLGNSSNMTRERKEDERAQECAQLLLFSQKEFVLLHKMLRSSEYVNSA